MRTLWIREKDMKVLQFWSDTHRETPVDVFVALPFDFRAEFAESLHKPLSGVGPVHYVSYPTLVRMKEAAGREQDLIDVRELRLLHEPEKTDDARRIIH